MDFVGNLTIDGDLYMYEGLAISPKLSGMIGGNMLSSPPLNHSVIVLGATGITDGDLHFNFTVTGKMYLEKMSLSYVPKSKDRKI